MVVIVMKQERNTKKGCPTEQSVVEYPLHDVHELNM